MFASRGELFHGRPKAMFVPGMFVRQTYGSKPPCESVIHCATTASGPSATLLA